MKKNLLFIFLLFFNCTVFAQMKDECRVYYLDCSYSMVTNGIWDKVRDNLKNAIDNVTDETTDLYVIPFTDDGIGRYPLPVYFAKATVNGKSLLKEKIDNLECFDKVCTMHYVPLNHFLCNFVKPNKLTYFFLMTDGKNNRKIGEFQNLLSQWDSKVKNSNVYGFFVMLYKAANDAKVVDIINRQKYFWKVETADVNINIIYIDKTALFNVRNDKYIEIPYTGKLSLEDIKLRIEENPYYFLGKVDIIGNNLRLEIKNKKSTIDLPSEVRLKIKINDILDNFTFIVTDEVCVSCINKKEYALKLKII